MVGDKKRRLSGKILTGAFALPVAVSTVQQNVASANLSDDLFLQENDKIGHTLGKLKDLVKEQNFYSNGFVFRRGVICIIEDFFDEESLKLLRDVALTEASIIKGKDVKKFKVKSFNKDGTITFSFFVNGKEEEEITSKKIDDDFQNIMKFFNFFLKVKFKDNSEGFRLRTLIRLMSRYVLFENFFAEGISFTSKELPILFSKEDLVEINNMKGEKTFNLESFNKKDNTFCFDVLVDGKVRKYKVESKSMKMDSKVIMQVFNFLLQKATENKSHFLKIVEK